MYCEMSAQTTSMTIKKKYSRGQIRNQNGQPERLH